MILEITVGILLAICLILLSPFIFVLLAIIFAGMCEIMIQAIKIFQFWRYFGK